MRRQWQQGQPPRDGACYEMRRRFRVCFTISARSPYAWRDAVWSPSAWWNGKTYVERNQFTGEERWLNNPDEWRPIKKKTLR